MNFQRSLRTTIVIMCLSTQAGQPGAWTRIILERVKKKKKRSKRRKSRGERSDERGRAEKREREEDEKRWRSERDGRGENSMKTQRMLRTRGSDLEIYVESMTGWEACLRNRGGEGLWRKRRRGLLKRRVAQKPTEWIHGPLSSRGNAIPSSPSFAVRVGEK